MKGKDNMEKIQIEKIIQESIVSVKKDVTVLNLKPQTSLIEDLNFDSMALVQLAGELEGRFNRPLPLAEWVNQNQGKKLLVGDLIKFISDLQ
ncbi:MAG TPA: acyl carrier protein [Bdellovibrionota bacterium]|nr:acyl carrier protein [Bdellovibrionota bacterium]